MISLSDDDFVYLLLKTRNTKASKANGSGIQK